jgi:hypothetical protein
MAMRSALWAVILMSAVMVMGEERQTLELVWLDAHRLLPDFERVRAEANVIFRDLGVAVRWEVGIRPGTFRPGRTPSAARRWR